MEKDRQQALLLSKKSSTRTKADLDALSYTLGKDFYTNKEQVPVYDWKLDDGSIMVHEHRAYTKALASKFYLSPYLTCQECNTLHMVDSSSLFAQIVALLQKGQGLSALSPESLPVCTGCGLSYAFAVGAEDYSSAIEASKVTLEKLREIRAACALKVQIAYRGLAGRKEILKKHRRKRARKKEMRLAATRVANRYRIHMAHRIVLVRRAVKRVCNAHYIVITQALKSRQGELKVYWHDREEELDLLREDYRELVRRSGFSPPMHVAERNYLEMEKRVHEIECMYATRVQKRFRGMVGRRFMIFYRKAVARRVGYHNTAALRVQLFFRYAFSRKALRKLQFEKKKAQWLKDYKDVNAAERRDANRKAFTDKVKKWYNTEREQELVARYTGKTAFGACDGKRQIAFQQSPYADSEPVDLNIKVVRDEEAAMREEELERQRIHTRRLFLLSRFDDHPAFRILFEDEMNAVDEAAFRMKLELDERKRGMTLLTDAPAVGGSDLAIPIESDANDTTPTKAITSDAVVKLPPLDEHKPQ